MAASKQASTYVNTLPQCSPASVGLAQACPNFPQTLTPTFTHTLHTLACTHTQTQTHTQHIHTPLHILAHPCTSLHTLARTNTNSNTQHIHTPSYSSLIPRPSFLQFSFACSMLKRREKAWGFLHHMLSHLYVYPCY